MLDKVKKYLWIVKLVFGLALLLFIFWKVWNEPVLDELGEISLNTNQWLVLGLVVILMPLNWLVETAKWKVLMDGVHKLSWKGAFLSVLAGVSTGLLTPNRIGNFLGRTVYTSKEVRTKSIIYTFQTNLAQFCASMLMGVWGAILFQSLVEEINTPPALLYIIASLIFVLASIVFFQPQLINKTFIRRFLKDETQKDIEEAGNISAHLKRYVLILSLFRYCVFALQFYLLLFAFGVNESALVLFSAIAFVYLITTAIPSVLFGKLFVREASALFVFGMLGVPSTIILITAFLLWLINLAFPSLIGAWVLIRKS